MQVASLDDKLATAQEASTSIEDKVRGQGDLDLDLDSGWWRV